MRDTLSKLEKAQIAYVDFSKNIKTLVMATVNKDGIPNASYTPYVKAGSDLYIYVSELAEHTQNLTHNKAVSVFLVEDESKTRNLHVRRRLTYICDIHKLDLKTDAYNAIMDQFAEKFGSTISLLRDLEDFHLFKLTPNKGSFVIGFGQAFTITGDNLEVLKHQNERGHTSSKPEVTKKMNAISG